MRSSFRAATGGGAAVVLLTLSDSEVERARAMTEESRETLDRAIARLTESKPTTIMVGGVF